MTKEKKELSFEEGFQRLEVILKQMQEGSLPLETQLSLFEEGDGLLKSLGDKLSSAQQRIEKLVGDREIPFEPEEAGNELVSTP